MNEADPTGPDNGTIRLLVERDSEYALVVLDPAGHLVSWNPGAVGIFGWTAEEVVGAPWPALSERQRGEFRDLLANVFKGNAITGLELTRYRKDGSEVQVTLSAVAIRDDHGSVTGIASILADISERKRGEAAQRLLAEAGRTLASSLDYARTLQAVARLVVESVADWCTIDVLEDGEHVRAVEIAANDQAVEEQLRELNRRYPPNPDVANDVVGRVLRTGKSELVTEITAQELDAAALDEDHRLILQALAPRSLMIVPLRARERVLGAITLYFAASDRRFGNRDLELAEELASRAAQAVDNARLYRAAQRAIRVRDEVVGIVAHDLRNPLSTIIMGAGMIRDDALERTEDAFALRMATSVVRSAESMNRLIGDLLDVAKIESGTFAVDLRSYPVSSIMREVLDQFGNLGKERGITIELEVAGIESAVAADLDRILQVFSNLIGNGIKFCEPGGRVTLLAEPAGEFVVFSIRDTGCGMPADSIPHLFNRFWQARSHRRGGAGLGLTICKGIIEAHHGRIEVHSEEGQGSTFSFWIPRSEDPIAEREVL